MSTAYLICWLTKGGSALRPPSVYRVGIYSEPRCTQLYHDGTQATLAQCTSDTFDHAREKLLGMITWSPELAWCLTYPEVTDD